MLDEQWLLIGALLAEEEVAQAPQVAFRRRPVGAGQGHVGVVDDLGADHRG